MSGAFMRRYLWRATYRDGGIVEERDAQGVSARFEDVQREKLARFSLLEEATRREVLGFDAATGVFTVRGKRVEFWLGDRALTGCDGTSCRDVLQFKSAHADWRAGVGASGTVVDAHHLGYRAALPGLGFEVVLRLDARTGRVAITARVEPRQGAPSGPFFVLVAGVRVDSKAEFEEALSPRWSPGPSAEEVA